MDYSEGNKRTISNEKDKKKKRRGSATFLTKQTVGGTSKQSKKELKKPRQKKVPAENTKKRKSGEKDKSKSKEREQMRPIKPEGTGFRKKRSINVDRESEEDTTTIPFQSISTLKRKSQP